MKHCNHGAKPLKSFEGAAPKCRGLGRSHQDAKGLEGAAPKSAAGLRGAASPRLQVKAKAGEGPKLMMHL